MEDRPAPDISAKAAAYLAHRQAASLDTLMRELRADIRAELTREIENVKAPDTREIRATIIDLAGSILMALATIGLTFAAPLWATPLVFIPAIASGTYKITRKRT